MIKRLKRALELTTTRLLWGWRFHSIGRRSALHQCRFVINPSIVSVGEYTKIAGGWAFADLTPLSKTSRPKIRIGSFCNIQHDFQCNAAMSIEVQDYVLIAPRVFITDSDHIVSESMETTLRHDFRSAPVVIEHNCWLGVNCVILKGVRIGHHSIVGANSVVTRDVPPFSTVGGVPAKIIATASANFGSPEEELAEARIEG